MNPTLFSLFISFLVYVLALIFSNKSKHAFLSNSDITLKDNVEDIDNNECGRLLETISPKTYTRNDLNNEKRVGFISNEFDNELNDDMKNIVGSNKDDEGNHLTTTLDYARLTTILWGVCQQLNERIKALEGYAV